MSYATEQFLLNIASYADIRYARRDTQDKATVDANTRKAIEASVESYIDSRVRAILDNPMLQTDPFFREAARQADSNDYSPEVLLLAALKWYKDRELMVHPEWVVRANKYREWKQKQAQSATTPPSSPTSRSP